MCKNELNGDPLVSVYITTRNRPDLLKRAIESVKKQDYSNIEIVVVDDASYAETKKILLEEQERSGLIGLFNACQKGACYSRNKAIDNCSGAYVTGLDDDDFFLSEKRISLLMAAYDNQSESSDVAGVYDSVLVYGVSKRLIRFRSGVVDYARLKIGNCIGNQVLAPKEHFIGVGGFDHFMPAWQDWDLWLRMAKKYGIFVGIDKATYAVDECLGQGRISGKSEEYLRRALDGLAKKNMPLSDFEKGALLVALQAYPQVRLRLDDIKKIFLSGNVKGVVRVLLNKIILHNLKKMHGS